ncbi:MAG: alpha/beta fold hydrolase [Chloroflexota bacterium]|nr:alpha/beta fold hydrolase [Chloroflexota bacterium]
MPKTTRRLRRALRFGVLGALSTVGLAAVVTLQHKINTPQPLDSILPGEAHIYRWKQGHIFYKVLGAAEAPPLVLFHAPGIGASADEMCAIMQPLAAHYRVYAPDLLGFGLSDRPHLDYSAETYIALFHDFLSEVIGKQATLLASGLSCNYAVALAARMPTLCARLVLISPVDLFMHQSAQDARRELIYAPIISTLLYPLVSTRFALRYKIERKHTENQRPAQCADLDQLYATTHQFGAEHAPLALLAGSLTVDVLQRLEKIAQPTLIIWGTLALSKVPDIASRYHIAAHTQVVLIRDAGASVHEENPEVVVTDILEWSQDSTVIPAPHTTASSSAPAVPDTIVPEAPVPDAAISEAVTPVATPEPASQNVEAPLAGIRQTDAPQTGTPQAERKEVEIEAYCVKCKKKRMMRNVHEVTMKNGRPALQGACGVCGTRLYRIGRL